MTDNDFYAGSIRTLWAAIYDYIGSDNEPKEKDEEDRIINAIISQGS